MEKDDKLVELIEKIIRLEEEKKSICDDIREVLAECKGNGYDVKAIRQVLKLRKLMPADRAEYTYLVSEYSKQIGLEE